MVLLPLSCGCPAAVGMPQSVWVSHGWQRGTAAACLHRGALRSGQLLWLEEHRAHPKGCCWGPRPWEPPSPADAPAQVMELSWTGGGSRWLSQLPALIALHHAGMEVAPCSEPLEQPQQQAQVVPGPGKLLRGCSVTKFGIGKELGTGAGRWCGVPDRWSPLPVSRLQPRGAHSRTCPSSAPGAFPPWGRARGPAASSNILCLSRLVLAWAIRSSVKQDWGSDARVLQQLGREVANKEILQ